MMWNDGGWGPAGWILMTMMMVVFVGGLIALVIWFVGSVGANPQATQTPTIATAHQVLGERFARGEIDEDEFKRRRDLLEAG